MKLTRRDFLSAAALVVTGPPMPPGFTTPLESPKGAELTRSLQKVSVEAIAPSVIPQPPPGGVTGLTISVTNGTATISWQSGTGPFQVEQAPTTTGPWNPVGPFTMQRSVTVPVSGPSAFFRIHERMTMPVEVAVDGNGAHVSWLLPQL